MAARTDGTALTGADRVLLTLKTLAGHSSGVSLDAISRELGAPKSSIHRALAALRRAGFADQDERGHYRLGSELVRITFDYHERRDVVDLVRPVLSTLSTWLSETAHYAQLEGAEVVYLAKIEPTGQGITMTSRIGGRNPAHSTGVGKAMLAHVLVDDDAVREFVAATGRSSGAPRTPSSRRVRWPTTCAWARERGYALDREESELGVNCIAFPLFLGSGRSRRRHQRVGGGHAHRHRAPRGRGRADPLGDRGRARPGDPSRGGPDERAPGGRRVLVTGGGRGLGRAIALAVRARGRRRRAAGPHRQTLRRDRGGGARPEGRRGGGGGRGRRAAVEAAVGSWAGRSAASTGS